MHLLGGSKHSGYPQYSLSWLIVIEINPADTSHEEAGKASGNKHVATVICFVAVSVCLDAQQTREWNCPGLSYVCFQGMMGSYEDSYCLCRLESRGLTVLVEKVVHDEEFPHLRAFNLDKDGTALPPSAWQDHHPQAWVGQLPDHTDKQIPKSA